MPRPCESYPNTVDMGIISKNWWGTGWSAKLDTKELSLSWEEPPFDTAFELAQIIQEAKRDAQNYKKEPNTWLELNYSTIKSRDRRDKDTNKGTMSCYCWGGLHLAPVSKFDNMQCYFCKKGHIAKVCCSKQSIIHQKSGTKKNFYLYDRPKEEYKLFTLNTPLFSQ